MIMPLITFLEWQINWYGVYGFRWWRRSCPAVREGVYREWFIRFSFHTASTPFFLLSVKHFVIWLRHLIKSHRQAGKIISHLPVCHHVPCGILMSHVPTWQLVLSFKCSSCMCHHTVPRPHLNQQRRSETSATVLRYTITTPALQAFLYGLSCRWRQYLFYCLKGVICTS